MLRAYPWRSGRSVFRSPLLFCTSILALLCMASFGCWAADAASKPASTQDLPHFEAIHLSGLGELYIKQRDQENFSVEADEKLLPLVQMSVKDKTLYIGLKEGSQSSPNIKYYLNIKDIQRISSSSASKIFIADGLQTPQLQVDIGGFGGEATLNLNVKKLVVNIEGGGKIMASGIANTQTISIRGAGEFEGKSLVGDSAVLQLTGTGVAKINVRDTLKVELSGDSAVQYCAKPNISQSVSDNGKLTRLEGC